MKTLRRIMAGLAILALLIFVVWAERYHYCDCRRVGHTRLYCILDIFR